MPVSSVTRSLQSVLLRSRLADWPSRPRRRLTWLAVGAVVVSVLSGGGTAWGASSSAEAYRAVSGATASGDYQVTIDGHTASVTAYKDVAYTSFAFQRPASVTVARTGGLLTGARLLPAGRASVTASSASTLTFTIPSPADLVLTVPGAPRLFLFADALGASPMAPAGQNVHDVTGLGVDPAGPAVQTAQIQHAIDTVAGQGGGVVYFPPGRYLTGTLEMRSHVTLFLGDGALIQGTGNPSDYPVDPGRTETGTNGRTMTFSRLIYFDGVHNAGITGRGVIDGDGKALRQAGRNSNLIRVVSSQDVRISNVVLRDSAAWNTHVLYSTNVQVDNVRIINDVTNPNTDGVDVDSSSATTVQNVFAYVGDDALVVKATDNSDLLADPHGITFRDCVLVTNKTAMKLGTESLASTFSNIQFQGNAVVAADRAIGLVSSDGAAFRDIGYTGNTVYQANHVFEESLAPRTGSTAAGAIDGVTVDQLQVFDYHPSGNITTNNNSGFAFVGYNVDHQVAGLTFTDVSVNGWLLTGSFVAAERARLNFGPYVQEVAFQVTGPAPTPVDVQLASAGTMKAGKGASITATFTDQGTSGRPITNLRLTLQTPLGWDVQPATADSFTAVPPGQQVQTTWTVTPPAGFFGATTLYAQASYQDPSGNRQLSVLSDGATASVQSDLVTNVSPAELADLRIAQPGTQFLADRTYTLSSVPDALMGGVLIPGANADKSATSPADYLTFDVSRDATIYAAFDLRGQGTWWPAWLADDGFQLTGMQIQDSDHPYAVFEKQVPAGQVVLGPNSSIPNASNLNSYFTIVTPR